MVQDSGKESKKLASGNGKDSGGEAASGAVDGPPFRMVNHFLKDLSFENPRAVDIILDGSERPDINLKLDVKVDEKTGSDGKKLFEVVLELKVDAKSAGEVLYLCEIAYGSVIELTTEVRDEVRAAILLMEVPHLLFPFAHSIVSATVRGGGFGFIHAQPVNWAAFFKSRIEQAQKVQAEKKQKAS